MSDSRPLGILDSGIGGLFIAKEIKRICPQERILYFGDSEHFPYASKSPEKIKEFGLNITRYLINQNCKIIVVSSNIIAANAIEDIINLADRHDVKVIDAITPVTKKIAFSFFQETGVIGSRFTIRTKIYRKKIRKFNKHIKVKELATPLLVPLIEEGLLKSEVSKAMIKHYLSNTRLENIDSLILGCNHYSFIVKEINEFYDGRVEIINTPLIVANEVALRLIEKDLQSSIENPVDLFYMSDLSFNLKKLANKIFGKNIQAEQKNSTDLSNF